MLFTSPVFLFGFLPLLFLLYYLTPQKGKNLILFVFSLFFYAWGELAYVGILLFTVFFAYTFGRLLAFTNYKISVLTLAVALHLSVLVYYKYFTFILVNFGIDTKSAEAIHLPLGISFFTFQAISYLVDIYRRKTTVQKNIIDLGLYISLFSQLIAGPIVRYNSIAEQIKQRSHRLPQFVSGVERFSYGLAKKVLIANTLASIADPIFALDNAELNFSLVWLALICFSLQIYFDFSAYSDMAIGLGRMFGFQFQENFNYPYISTSIKEFWKRWHISLSTWFRDYLYIPLGGSRKGRFRTYLNLIIVFVTCGLWHGASWNFLIWGVVHGAFLILERLGLASVLLALPKLLRHIYALLVILISWVFFKIESFADALYFLKLMFGFGSGSEIYTLYYFINNQFIWTFIVALILCTPVAQSITTLYPNKEFMGSRLANTLRVFAIGILLFASLVVISAMTYNPFIYFRF